MRKVVLAHLLKLILWVFRTFNLFHILCACSFMVLAQAVWSLKQCVHEVWKMAAFSSPVQFKTMHLRRLKDDCFQSPLKYLCTIRNMLNLLKILGLHGLTWTAIIRTVCNQSLSFWTLFWLTVNSINYQPKKKTFYPTPFQLYVLMKLI